MSVCRVSVLMFEQNPRKAASVSDGLYQGSMILSNALVDGLSGLVEAPSHVTNSDSITGLFQVPFTNVR